MREDSNNDSLPDGIYSTVVDVSSGTREPGYDYMQGTSMAAPHVSGVLALMKARFPQLTPDIVDAVLAQTRLTTDIWKEGWDEKTGFGLIDAFKTVQEADRLAGLFMEGAPLPVLPPRLEAQPDWLNVGHVAGQITQEMLTIRNSGGRQQISITSITSSQAWLTVDANSVDEQGLGTYVVSVDSLDLLPGDHSALITMTVVGLEDSDVLTVPVSLVVAETSEDAHSRMAPQYVHLYDAVKQEVVARYQSPVNRRSSEFKFYNVPLGSYYLLTGSDVDKDSIICQSGETCGGWPDLMEIETFEYSGHPVSDRNIILRVNGALDLSIDGDHSSTKGITRWAPSDTDVTDKDLPTTRAVH